MTKPMTIAVWTATVLVAAAFLLAGAPKVAGKAVEGFAQVGYPAWFAYAIGALEVGGALLLLFPRTATIGGALLVAIMIGAVATHIKSADAAHAPPAVILGLLAAFVAWQRRGRLRGAGRPAGDRPQGEA